MKILVTGNSHTATLSKGYRSRNEQAQGDGQDAELFFAPLGRSAYFHEDFFAKRRRRVVITHPQMRRRVHRFAPEDPYEWYALCCPMVSTRLLRSRQTWETFDLPDETTGRAPMSQTLLNQILDQDQRQACGFARSLARLGLRVVVVEPPRLFRHVPVAKRLGAERCLEVDRLLRGRAREILERSNIPVATVPEEAVDEDGFMKDELSEGAANYWHGNAAFGDLMVTSLLATVQSIEAL